MANGMRIQAKFKNGVTEVKALINHPMETGTRKDQKTGKLIPGHYITELKCEHQGVTVMDALWSGGISKNPYMSFKFNGGAVGDEVKVSWKDNQGGSDELAVKAKG
jgi:sulfur-oxidizing protein SoxZ